MATHNQVELGSLPVGDKDDLTSERYRTTVPSVMEGERDVEGSFDHSNKGGWKTMPFIIGITFVGVEMAGNAGCEYLVTVGFSSNFIVYLTKEFHMSYVTATYVITLLMGTKKKAPILGAFIADSYLGKYWTIALGSIATSIAMVLLSLTAIFPQFRPPPCNANAGTLCRPASGHQIALLYSSFIMMAIGAGGIRPCSLVFGADQFDYKSEKGKRSIQSYFNWSYFSVMMSVLFGTTVIVYIQTYISWGWGFGIPTILMCLSVTSLFLAAKLYIRVTPEGSSFTRLLQVLVAAVRKCHLSLPSQTSDYYDPPQNGVVNSRMARTDQFMFLNKASIKVTRDFKEDGSVAHPWRLCSLQHVEELKSLIRIGPIWLSTIGLAVSLTQQYTFFVLQADTMDTHVGKHFQIPAGSFAAFSMLAVILFLPIYDRHIVPFSKRMTKEGRGITILQRMGVGYAVAIVSMAIAAVVETKRRNVALSHGLMEKPGDVIPMSALWLVPQYFVSGLAESLGLIGGLEFLYSQFPENLRSVAGAVFFVSSAVGSYLSSFIINIVQNTTGRPGHNNWLPQNLNKGKLDNFYWLLAVYEAVNLVYFVVIALRYRYKATVEDQTTEAYSIVGQDNEILDHV